MSCNFLHAGPKLGGLNPHNYSDPPYSASLPLIIKSFIFNIDLDMVLSLAL
jgi:hypothetical protein